MTTPELQATICTNCTEPVGDSMGDDFGICQMCWEAECSESWWRMAEDFPGAVCPATQVEANG